VGSELLAQLLADLTITKVTCLTRQPLAIQSTKAENLLHSDFSSFDDILASTLADHDGCIWALGTKATDTPDPFESAYCKIKGLNTGAGSHTAVSAIIPLMRRRPSSEIDPLPSHQIGRERCNRRVN
jgi:hypothetical protein